MKDWFSFFLQTLPRFPVSEEDLPLIVTRQNAVSVPFLGKGTIFIRTNDGVNYFYTFISSRFNIELPVRWLICFHLLRIEMFDF